MRFMVAVFDSPDFMFNDINISELSKTKKLYLFTKGILVGYIYKRFNGVLFCNLINLFFPSRMKIKYINDVYVKKVLNSKNIFYPNKRIVRVVNNDNFHFNFMYETYCLDEINLSNEDIVIDCGANVGELMYSFSQKQITPQYIGFEPDPKTFYCLSKNIQQFQNGKVYNSALSNTNGFSSFYIDSLGANSSLDFFGSNTKEEVSVVTLDSMDFKNIKLLKVEAEGHEEEVLKGSINTLKNTEYVVVDYGPEKGIQQKTTISEVIKILNNNNFDLISSSKHRQVGLFKNLKIHK